MLSSHSSTASAIALHWAAGWMFCVDGPIVQEPGSKSAGGTTTEKMVVTTPVGELVPVATSCCAVPAATLAGAAAIHTVFTPSVIWIWTFRLATAALVVRTARRDCRRSRALPGTVNVQSTPAAGFATRMLCSQPGPSEISLRDPTGQPYTVPMVT